MKTNVNNFSISNHMALKDIQASRVCLNLTSEYELHILPNRKDSSEKDHG